MIEHKQDDQQESDLPKLSQPANRALASIGISRPDQLTTVTEAELLKLHGFGPSGLNQLRNALAAKGLTFADAARKEKND
jgi:hypothetical protein